MNDIKNNLNRQQKREEMISNVNFYEKYLPNLSLSNKQNEVIFIPSKYA